jgi:hypothetical protein
MEVRLVNRGQLESIVPVQILFYEILIPRPRPREGFVNYDEKVQPSDIGSLNI